MTDLMKIVLALTVSGTALAAVLALLRRVLRDRLPKAVFYYLWLLVLLRLIVPAALPVPGLEKTAEPPAVQIQTPATPVQIDPGQPVVIPPATTQTTPAQPSAPVPQQSQQVSVTPWYQPAWAFLCDRFAILWLTGAALHFLWFAVSYLRFSRGLKEDCVPLLEHEQALLDDLRGDVKVTACRSPLARTPMLLGLVRPRIILPETPITTRELEYILRHELTHLRRRDLLYKWFTVAVTSAHWFNPLMPWLRREIARCGELSCDEGVIASMDTEHKRQYGETLLALAAAGALPRGVPATTLCEEKTQLKERLVGIVKYRKATLLMALLSAVLALLVAGCAAVLGPQLKKETFTGPLTEEQQAPVLENIRAWAEENIQADGELTVTYSEPSENPQGMGSLVEIATVHLYDLSSNTIRPVDGIYPDSEKLGYVTLMVKTGENVREIQVFYLTGGDPAKGTSPVESLKQFAAAYPDATARYLSWEQRNGQPVYIKIFFNNEGRENIFEYSGVCGRWGVREKDSDSGKRAAIPLADLPWMMERIVQWQTANGGDTDGRNFTLVNGMTLETPAFHGILDQVLNDWQTVQVYNMATGDLYTLEGDYTGAVEYGCFTLLNVEDPESRIFLIDNDDKDPVTPEPAESLAGQVAVLTKNAPLDNAFVQTVDTEGRTVVMDMAMALKKGDLVYVESQEGETCMVTVLSGEPPRPQGWLDETILATDIGSLQEANQVILKDTKMWYGDPDDGVFSDSACTGVANVEKRKTVTRDTWSENGVVQTQDYWLQVTLPGGGDPFWVRREDVSFLWPLSEPLPEGEPFLMRDVGGGRFAVLYNTVHKQAKQPPVSEVTICVYDSKNGTLQALAAEEMEKPSPDQLIVDAGRILCCSGTGEVLAFEETSKGWTKKDLSKGSELIAISPYQDKYARRLDEAVEVRSWSSDEQLARLDGVRNVNRMVWNADGTRLLVLYEHAFVTVWDLTTNTTIRYQGSHPQQWVGLNDVGFLNGGDHVFLYYLQENGSIAVTVWDLKNGTVQTVKEGGELTVEDTLGALLLLKYKNDRQEELAVYDCRNGSLQVLAQFIGCSAACFADSGQKVLANACREPDAVYQQMLISLASENFQNGVLPDLSGKSYYYEGGGFSGAGDFTLKLHEDGTFGYYEGLLSSHIGMGSWTVEDDTLVLREDTFSRVFRFRVEDGGLSYIKAASSSFSYVKLEDGARFLEDTQTVEPETSFLYQKTADWLAQEFHQVYDPYYDVQSLTISNWQESGSEATFHYKMCWLNYNRDPDTVDYVVQAKKAGQAAYETLYNDYLALKEANYIFKIVWEGEQPLLYSDVSPTGPEEWEPTEVRDFVLRPKTN